MESDSFFWSPYTAPIIVCLAGELLLMTTDLTKSSFVVNSNSMEDLKQSLT